MTAFCPSPIAILPKRLLPVLMLSSDISGGYAACLCKKRPPNVKRSSRICCVHEAEQLARIALTKSEYFANVAFHQLSNSHDFSPLNGIALPMWRASRSKNGRCRDATDCASAYMPSDGHAENPVLPLE
jgi:hypothetical protein